MKRIAGFLGVVLALGGSDPLSSGQGQWGTVALGAAAGQVAAGSPISKDDGDNEDGDDPSEGTGVVDPVPQDDGSDGVDKPRGQPREPLLPSYPRLLGQQRWPRYSRGWRHQG